MDDSSRIIRARLDVTQTVVGRLAEYTGVIVAVADEIIRAFREGRKVLLFGNGGSAADAQHIAAELVGRFNHRRQALPAHALTVNPSVVTAIGNDYGFAQIFARQIEAFGKAGDIAVGISTSGRSPNVVEGLRAARSRGLTTVALTGEDGAEAANVADFCLRVPATDTARIQEAHILIGHLLCELVERAFLDAT